MKSELPAAFLERLEVQMPAEEKDQFCEVLEGSSPISIQMHPLKGKKIGQELERVPWYVGGSYLQERPLFTLDPRFQAGAYYVQEASSMFVAWLLKQLRPENDPIRVLDLCAAPGGKSCLLAANLPPGSLLISNEVIKTRAGILRYNLAKWGMDNCWVTSLDPERLAPLADFFDLVVVDAPCSGEGLFRKDLAARAEWSEALVAQCAARQGRILRAAVPLIRPGGHLIYSTCTYNRAENVDQLKVIEEEFGLPQVVLAPPQLWGIESEGAGHQFYPHRLRGEGFFAAAFRKPAEMGLEQPVTDFSVNPSVKNSANTRLSQESMTDFSVNPSKKSNLRKYKKKKRQYQMGQNFASASPFPHWTPVNETSRLIAKKWLEHPSDYNFYQDKSGQIYALNQKFEADAIQFARVLGRIDLGFPIGQIKGKQFVPAPELALHTALSTSIPSREVDRKTALALLQKETPPLPELERGFHLITYRGHGLLWIKGVGNRYNNYYPSNWRIRMDIPRDLPELIF